MIPDGRLKLIDGHLRQSQLDPDTEVDVEVLDVNDDEARQLTLSLDPLAALAAYDDAALDQEGEQTHPWPENARVLDGFPDDLSIKDIAEVLSSVGFSSPPAWLRPYHVLSTGQRFRVTLARLIAKSVRSPLTQSSSMSTPRSSTARSPRSAAPRSPR
jgi:ATPase subunit of ABC transporter with duplicated ATPase domains